MNFRSILLWRKILTTPRMMKIIAYGEAVWCSLFGWWGVESRYRMVCLQLLMRQSNVARLVQVG